MSSRLLLVVLAAAVAVAGVLALGAAHAITGRAAPQTHTIYCQKGDGLPVGFEAGSGLPAGCPPGFRLVSG